MKERIYRSLPFVLVVLGAFGIMITDQLWIALVSLAGVWLLPSPVATNVSRETIPADPSEYPRGYLATAMGTGKRVSDVSRETITSPCAFLHGSAEPHVPGCEGWTFELP